MSATEELKEPTFGPIVTDQKAKESEVKTGWKGGSASADPDPPAEDDSASEEENESRIPGDPRDINEQQPPTSIEF